MITEHAIFALRERSKPGIHLGLQTITALLKALGNPQDQYRKVLVVGTNGKGSTSQYLARFCQDLGVKTGLYTSPHLVSLNERISVDGKCIGDDPLQHYLDQVQAVSKNEDLSGSFFELITAVAHLYFVREKIELAVLEAGLGGRLDATNVGDFELAIVTDISQDHREYLGETIAAIAREKVAVIQRGGIVVSSWQRPEVMEVLEEEIHKKDARLFLDQRDFVLEGEGERASFHFEEFRFSDLSLPLPGEHQRRNLSLALAAICLLGKKGILNEEIAVSRLQRVLKAFTFPGRFQILSDGPIVLVDGAHNEASMAGLFQALAEKGVKPGQLHVVMAIKEDKDWVMMLKQVPQGLASMTCTRVHAQTDSGMGSFVSPNDLYEESLKMKLAKPETTRVAVNPLEAVKEAQRLAIGAPNSEKPWVVITGSLYLVGEILKEEKETICRG